MITKKRSNESCNATHEFAFFISLFSSIVQSIDSNQELIITDDVLFHRMKTVVRLKLGDHCIFFDRLLFAECEIKEFIGKKQIRCVMRAKHKTQSIVPSITFLLPLLKKEDYEHALYTLAEMGITTVQLVFTQKSRSSWGGIKDIERAQRIFIAASEQSKNFSYPELKGPILLQEALAIHASKKIFFDPMGDNALSVCNYMHVSPSDHIVLCVGPEGDLTHSEKEALKNHNFIFCALTQTVLRSVQAVAVSSGLVRSLWR